MLGGASFCYNRYMESTEGIIESLEALEIEAAAFAMSLTPKAAGATLVTLSGELGAGKTTFTQGVAKALGITDHITSPTFVLEKRYAIPAGVSGFTKLVHIDAYRLEGKSLAPLALPELLSEPATLILLEWPEMTAGALPPADVGIALKVIENEHRTLSYVYPEVPTPSHA